MKKLNCNIKNIFPFIVLSIAIIIGAHYRLKDIKENFAINNGFEFYVEMASHFWIDPGGYNFEEGLKMMKNPENYVFTHHPQEPATGSFENEKGWEFILSLIFKEGARGMQNLAMAVIRCQLILDLLVIVALFFVGKSISGSLGGSLAAILYALFKPSVRMVSWVSYYYWAIPFSVVSLLFWTVIYRPEKKRRSLKILCLIFFLYGSFIGFAVSIRLGFLFLPLAMSPLLFLRERSFKRGIILLVAMLIGEAILLLPQISMTHKWYGKWNLSVRGKWHHVISGLGAYSNPFGIQDSGDLTAVKWAIDRGGPDLNKVGIQEYDQFMKKEAVSLFKKRPDIFFSNFMDNFYSGITMIVNHSARYSEGPAFFGVLDSEKKYLNIKHDPKILKLGHYFPWIVFFGGLTLFFFRRKDFLPFMTIIIQGVYLLAVLCIYFPPIDIHITSYFPVFVALLAISSAILLSLIVWAGKLRLKC